MKCWSRCKSKIIKNSDQFVVELFENGYRVAKGQHGVQHLNDWLLMGTIIL
ncbi:MAG: hypothetical protein J6S86_01555 [Alphaproteobacteria bacterium]|nr:hypothetical protein [Alphaproteobacteria bacterium]